MEEKSTKSGYDFQVRLEDNVMVSSGLFGNDLNRLSNIYEYTELINNGVSDINNLLLNAEENKFLIKNYPLHNSINNAIEFCIKTKSEHEVQDCYIECKYHEVGGTAYQKLSYYLSEHKITHGNNGNSFMVLVYDGNDFLGNTQTSLHVQNVRENYIGHNFRQLILSVTDFKQVFMEKLRDCTDMNKIFVEMKAEGY